MSKLWQARFYKTVNHLRDLPKLDVPEVAFVGRSNAGKSSAINTLCNQKSLAFASKTPGRTQHINFFSTVAHMSASTGTILSGKAKSTCFWSICPGYGFAQVSGSAKEHWQKLLSDYLIHRQQLTGLVLVMDARHPFQPLDVQLLEWFAVTGKPVHCLLTKADKLNRSESTNALKQVDTILKSYVDEEGNPFPFTAQLFSSTKRIGIKEATDTILQLAGGNEPPDTPDLPEQ